MKIGYLGKQNSFAIELMQQVNASNPDDQFFTWLPGESAPVSDLDVVLATGKVGAAEFGAQTHLKLLQTASAGYDGVDVDAATEAGIWVASAPTTKTGNGESVAEFAVLLMLAASRRLNEALAYTRDSATNRSEEPETNLALYGKTACIVGLGGIGDLLVERLRGFGMVLTGVDSNPDHAPAGVKGYGRDDLKLAVADADYVILAIPGTKENENIIDAEMLAAMKKTAVLVNVSRGKLVDEEALLSAIAKGDLYGAGLDVIKQEPVKPNDPLLSQPRILVTPHIAGSTDLMLDGTVKYLNEVLDRFRKGIRPEGAVNQPDKPRIDLRET